IKKSLHLLRMEIHREDAMDTGCDQKIRNQFCSNWHPRFVLSILTCVPKKGNHGSDAVGAGPSRRIDHNKQLHQMIIRGRTGGLNDENIATANVLLDFNVGFAVGECADRGLAQRNTDVVADALGQFPIGGAAEHLHFRLEREHRRPQDYARRGIVCNTAPRIPQKKETALVSFASSKQITSGYRQSGSDQTTSCSPAPTAAASAAL